MKWASPCASSKKDLEDGVTAGGVGVGGGLAGGAQAVPAVDQGQDIVHRVHLSFGQPNYNHLVRVSLYSLKKVKYIVQCAVLIFTPA